MATSVAPRVYNNFIGGEWVDSKRGKTYENRNPANTDELVGSFVASNEADVNAAVDAAKEAYKTWRLCRRRSARRFCIAQRKFWFNEKKNIRKT